MYIYIPMTLCSDLQDVQIQPSQTKAPLPKMPISRLEVCTPRFDLSGDVPTPASLVRDKGKLVGCGDASHEFGVLGNGSESIGDRKVRAVELA